MRKIHFKAEPRSEHHKRQDDEGEQPHHKKKHGKHSKAGKDDGPKDEGSSQNGEARDAPAQSPDASSAAKAAQPASPDSSVPPALPAQAPTASIPAPPSGDGERTSLTGPASGNDAQSIQAPPAGTGLSVGVLSAAIAGGVVLLLVLLGVIFLCRKRRKDAVKTAGSAPDLRLKIGSPEIPGEKSVTDTFQIRDGGSRQVPQTSMQHGHVGLPMAHAQQSEFTLVDAERSKWPACNDSAAQPSRSDSCHSDPQQDSLSGRPELLPENGWDNIRAASPYESDDKEIDRCLSYYMKRRTRVSLPSAELAEGGEPSMLEDHTNSLPPSPVASRMSTRKSFVLPKTAGLLAKIRKSEIRLHNEALATGDHNGHPLPIANFSLDRGNGSSRPSMPGSDTPTRWSKEHESTFESLSLGRAGPDIPSHWRSSTRLRRLFADERDGLAVTNSSPGRSEPHAAFEYNDSYENQIPANHGTAWLGVGLGDGYDCYSATWQDRSPCRSSALSPRRSMTSTVRQRSATFSQCAPSRSPLFQENDADEAHAAPPMSARRLSQEANDVIRF